VAYESVKSTYSDQTQHTCINLVNVFYNTLQHVSAVQISHRQIEVT